MNKKELADVWSKSLITGTLIANKDKLPLEVTAIGVSVLTEELSNILLTSLEEIELTKEEMKVLEDTVTNPNLMILLIKINSDFHKKMPDIALKMIMAELTKDLRY